MIDEREDVDPSNKSYRASDQRSTFLTADRPSDKYRQSTMLENLEQNNPEDESTTQNEITKVVEKLDHLDLRKKQSSTDAIQKSPFEVDKSQIVEFNDAMGLTNRMNQQRDPGVTFKTATLDPGETNEANPVANESPE